MNSWGLLSISCKAFSDNTMTGKCTLREDILNKLVRLQICIIGKVMSFTSHEFLAMLSNFIMSSVLSMKTLNRTFICSSPHLAYKTAVIKWYQHYMSKINYALICYLQARYTRLQTSTYKLSLHKLVYAALKLLEIPHFITFNTQLQSST